MKLRPAFIFILFIALLLVGLISTYFSFRPEAPAQIAEKISKNLRSELEKLEHEREEIAISDTILSVPEDLHYPFFLYEDLHLVQWSDNQWIPPAMILADTFDVRVVHDGSADYLLKRWNVGKNKFLISTILLQRSFKIENEYISREWSKEIFPSGNIHILDVNSTLGVPICLDGQCLFRVSFFREDVPSHYKTKAVSAVAFSLALVLLIFLIYKGLPTIEKYSYDAGLGYLYISLGILRFCMVEVDFPNVFISSELFNPLVFASSRINASLGDLFLNLLVVLALCYYTFRNFHHFHVFHYAKKSPLYAKFSSVVFGLAFLFTFLFPFVTVQTLYNNSSLPLTISQSLQFDASRVIALLILLISGVCCFLLSHVFCRFVIGDRRRKRIVIAFGISVVLFAGINELSGQSYVSSLIIGVLYFSTVYYLRLYSKLRKFQYATFVYLIIAVFYLSVSAAYAINIYSRQEKIESQFRFARNFLIDRDYFGEYLLREASQRIGSDVFIQSRLVGPFLGKEAIRQKIRQIFLPSYFNKYDVNIFLFNASGDGIENSEEKSFRDYVSVYEQETFRTEYPGVYFVNNPQVDITQKYLVIVPVKRSRVIVGHIAIELSLKRIIPENVYPELLVDNRFQEFYRTQDLSFAVFVSKKIQQTSGTFNYDRFFEPDWLGNPDLFSAGVRRNGYDHIAQEDQNGKVAVVSSEAMSATSTFAEFSFLFVSGIALVLFIMLVQGGLSYLNGGNLFFSARIQMILNISFFLPLILVSITTLSLTSKASHQQLNNEFVNKTKAFAQQFAGTRSAAAGGDLFEMNDKFTELAQLSNLDANLYTTEGLLSESSQPLIAESAIISPYINPDALHKIRNGENLFVENEKIGKLTYFVVYTALKAPATGKLTGILGVPFFQSGYSLEKAQITILSNILNIFAGIFIVLLVLSYFVSRWLTFPLTFITQSLRRTSLVQTNKPLIWHSNDEIGLMAKEYNQMLYKLSESKAELEQTQREQAWREIAQQVAHEIKNPLTPMKLTLQQLERAVQQGSSTPEKTAKAVAAILSQVDTLNDIASSFSSFAKMPTPVIRELELVALVKRIVDLHSQSTDIHFSSSVRELFVMGDEQLLGRTFSNIVINAAQASRPGVASRIDIAIIKDGSKATIKFQDNGKGITSDVAERIFLPHFTTKKTGSGLGLAIAKQGIEQMKGSIWFETRENVGTTFFIQLPVV